MSNSEKNYNTLFDSINGTNLDLEYERVVKSGSSSEYDNFIKKNQISEIYDTDLAIWSLFFEQTLKNKDEFRIQNLYKKIMFDSDYIKSINIKKNPYFDSNELVIETNKGPISLIPLSEGIPLLLKIFPNLESINRANTCFSNSRSLSIKFSNDNDLVTGIIHGYTDKSKYLHSWLEIKLYGELYVIDYTMNAIINKDGYYRFRHANEISRVKRDSISNDIDNYGNIINALEAHSAFYNIFRNEIIKDLQKNKSFNKR